MVIAIIGVLVALLLPAVQAAREASRRTQCSNHLKQQALSIHNLHDTFGYMPQFGYAWPRGSTTLRQCSLFWAMLPTIEQKPLYDSLPAGQTSSAYFNSSNGGRLTLVKPYKCPSDITITNGQQIGTASNYNMNSYSANGQVFFSGEYPKLASMTDGTSQTVMVVEHIALCRDMAGGNTATNGRNVWPAINMTTGDSIVYWPNKHAWVQPAAFPGFGTNYPTAKIPDPANGNVLSYKTPQAAPKINPNGTCDPLTGNAFHPSVVLNAMGDGSVRGVRGNISLKTWNALLTMDQGEVVDDY